MVASFFESFAYCTHSDHFHTFADAVKQCFLLSICAIRNRSHSGCGTGLQHILFCSKSTRNQYKQTRADRLIVVGND